MMPFRRVAGLWALVPVKQLDRAKSRLADILDPADRKKLARAMLADVLGTLAQVDGLAGILVVTGDVEVAALAAEHDAAVIADPPMAGLNEAVLHGMRWLDRHHHAGAVVVPGDIPFVTVAELEAVIAATERSPIVVVPAIRDGGTNILAVGPPLLMPPAFGPESFARHLAAAHALGVTPQKLRLDGAGHDIDVAADLFIGAGPTRADPAQASHTQACHTRACLGRLLGVALSVSAGSSKEAFLP